MFKVVPISLLSLHMLFNNSICLLILLGLMKDVFQDFKSWGKLVSWLSNPFGSVMRIQDSFLKLPVLNHDVYFGLVVDMTKPWL